MFSKVSFFGYAILSVIAFSLFNRYIDKYPQDYKGYHNLGMCLSGLEIYDEAITNFMLAIELNPLCVDSFITASGLLIKISKPNLALSLCLKVLYLFTLVPPLLVLLLTL